MNGIQAMPADKTDPRVDVVVSELEDKVEIFLQISSQIIPDTLSSPLIYTSIQQPQSFVEISISNSQNFTNMIQIF